jgi:hypothetical protein
VHNSSTSPKGIWWKSLRKYSEPNLNTNIHMAAWNQEVRIMKCFTLPSVAEIEVRDTLKDSSRLLFGGKVEFGGTDRKIY